MPWPLYHQGKSPWYPLHRRLGFLPVLAFEDYIIFLMNNLTPQNRVLLEKLMVIQLIKKFPEFITVFTRAHSHGLSDDDDDDDNDNNLIPSTNPQLLGAL
jgi:hypothetical protein